MAFKGDFIGAEQQLSHAFSLFDRVSPSRSSVTWAYRSLGALLVGDSIAALEAARRARELAELGFPGLGQLERDIIRAEWLLGAAVLVALSSADTQFLKETDYLEQAETHLNEALIRCRRINMVDHEPDILLAWARWHHAKGNIDQARQDAGEALAIADCCEYRLKQAEIHNFLARLAWERVNELREMGDENGAAQAFAEAREHAEIAKERAWCDGPPHCYKPALEEAEGLLEEIAFGNKRILLR
jgi:hypothetical protein